MRNIDCSNEFVSLSGAAAEFSSLARVIRKSKAGKEAEFMIDGNRIKISCRGSMAHIFRRGDEVVISYSESCKSGLSNLISMPFECTSGSVFQFGPAQNPDIFQAGSMGLEIKVR